MPFDKKGTIIAAIIIAAFIAIFAVLISRCNSSSSSKSDSSSSEYHECYVCGDEADRQVGSYWYCEEHAELVEKWSN